MVLSENWKRLEDFFFKFLHFYEIAEIIFFKNFPPAVFNILKEPLLVQKQTLHQQKALDLCYLEPEGQGRGSLLVMPRPLLGCQIKAEIAGLLLMYRLFLY